MSRNQAQRKLTGTEAKRLRALRHRARTAQKNLDGLGSGENAGTRFLQKELMTANDEVNALVERRWAAWRRGASAFRR